MTTPRQINIRSDKAYALAADLAARRGVSMSRVIEDALAAYAAIERDAGSRPALLAAALAEDHQRVSKPDNSFRIEDLYDDTTGLPA
jgi:hypothetical protein